MIHLSEKTWQLPDRGIALRFPTTNILPYLLGQNETLTWDFVTPTTTTTYSYDSTCSTFSCTIAATTINHYDTGNSAINTAKTTAIYDYDFTRHPDYSVRLRVKQWLSEDPIGEQGGINLYGYCDNDPVNNVDSLGLWYLKGYGDETVAVVEKRDILGDLAWILDVDVADLGYKNNSPEMLQIGEELDVAKWINPLRQNIMKENTYNAILSYLKEMQELDKAFLEEGYKMGLADALAMASTGADVSAGTMELTGNLLRLKRLGAVAQRFGKVTGLLGGGLEGVTVYQAMNKGDTQKALRHEGYGLSTLLAMLYGGPAGLAVGSFAGFASLVDAGSEEYYEWRTKQSNQRLAEHYRETLDRIPKLVRAVKKYKKRNVRNAARARRILTYLHEIPDYSVKRAPLTIFSQSKGEKETIYIGPRIPDIF